MSTYDDTEMQSIYQIVQYIIWSKSNVLNFISVCVRSVMPYYNKMIDWLIDDRLNILCTTPEEQIIVTPRTITIHR